MAALAQAPDDADQRVPAHPIEPKARKFLEDEMQKFFFGEGSEKPPDFKPAG
jgi:Fe-S cluster biosynthesis and repair protein YggX